jgi:ectoine hydroxylase-related dioxygenase (phytanoyl-CoA dioxygenase family)
MALKQKLAARMRASPVVWRAYNLRHYRELRHNSEHYRRLGLNKSVVAPIAHRDVANRGDEAERPWLDAPGAKGRLRAHPDFPSFGPEIQGKLERWIDDGFMVLEGHLSEAQVDELNAEIERLFDQGKIKYHPLSQRIMNAYRQSAAVDRVVEDPELLRLLSFVLGRPTQLFQTINFFLGSQQAAHSDSFHMTTEPEGYLTAIWVALEDVEPDAGPLFYYPGSHRLPYLMSEDLEAGGEGESKEDRYSRGVAREIEAHGLERVDFLARKGDLLVWHANLLHGGHAIAREGATRKSLVAHYFAEGVLCYHELTERPAVTRARG